MKKTITVNSIFNVLYKGFDALFPLISATYVSHILLAEGVGKVAYANSIVAFFISIASLGIPNYGVKAIAQHRNNELEKSRCFWELFCINGVSTTVCLILYYLFVNCMPYYAQKQPLFNIMGLMLFLNIFNIDWYFQGVEEYSYIAVRSVVIKVLSFIATLMFVKNSEDYLSYALILCLALGGNYILNLFSLKKSIIAPVDGLNFGKHLKSVLVLLASALAIKIYTTLDSVMLEYFCGAEYVGYYSNPVKLIRIVYTVSIAAIAPFFPVISKCLELKEYEKSNKLLEDGLKIILLLATPCVIGTLLTAEHIVQVMFGASFLPAITTMRILSALIMIFSIAYLLGHIVLIAAGKERSILRATVVGLAVNFILNCLLIRSFKHNGAAFASVMAEGIVTLLMVCDSQRIYHIHIDKGFLISLIAANGLMALIVSVICAAVRLNIWGLLITVGSGVVVYAAGLLLFRNPFVHRLLKRERRTPTVD